MPDKEEEKGKLDYQRGKKLNEEYYIVSAHDNAEKATVTFAAYELESSETFCLPYSYSELDALFRHHAELANPANREGRYEWVIDRLDFVSDGTGTKRLSLASEPTPEDADGTERAVAKKVPTDRMTYAERQRQRQDMERLEEKRAQMIAQKVPTDRMTYAERQKQRQEMEKL